MAKRSAGILLYRRAGGATEVLLIHPGGPFWRNKDDGAWSIPKGELGEDEEPEACARREFEEELGTPLYGPVISLGSVRQKGGKLVEAFAAEGDLDADAIVSNHFTCEWPPRSGLRQSFAEVDRAAWFTLEAATEKLLEGQRPLLERLLTIL